MFLLPLVLATAASTPLPLPPMPPNPPWTVAAQASRDGIPMPPPPPLSRAAQDKATESAARGIPMPPPPWVQAVKDKASEMAHDDVPMPPPIEPWLNAAQDKATESATRGLPIPPLPPWQQTAYSLPSTPRAVTRAPAGADEFILGVQWSGARTVDALNTIGVPWTRFSVAWKSLQPTIDDVSITLDDVRDNPAAIEAFSQEANWGWLDSTMYTVIDGGMRPFPVVGLGWYTCYASYNGQDATPDLIGAEAYLAYMYLHVNAIVERYDGDGYLDAPGIETHHWQIENELNQAMLTAVYGWRYPAWLEGLTSMWADWDFLTDLLMTLNEAVHDADPDAITVQNLHTDIPPEYNRLFRQPGWPEAAELWQDHMDVMGFDAYPNYYYADPINGEVVGERVKILKERAPGKDIFAMEVGYPSGPTELGYTREKQAQFLDEAFHSAWDNGVSGYFYFMMWSEDTHSVTLTEEDKELLATVGHLFEDGRVLLLLGWALKNLDYIESHFIDVLMSVEEYWGLVDANWQPKPVWYTMEDIVTFLWGTSTP